MLEYFPYLCFTNRRRSGGAEVMAREAKVSIIGGFLMS